MYNIKLLDIKATNEYKVGYEPDDHTYIKIQLIGGYHKEKITVVFRVQYEELQSSERYLFTLAHYTFDFAHQVYDLFFGKGN